MPEKQLRLRLGLFVGATLVVGSVLVVLFGSAPQLFSTKARYTVLFPEAPGIVTGTPIRKSGVRIGEVTRIDLDSATGEVRVTITIDPKYPPRTNEAATITRGLLSGDTALDFLPKLDGAGQPLPRGDDLPPGSEIIGVPPITPRSLLTPASGVITSAQASLDRVVASFEKIERVAPQLEKTLREYELLAADVRKFVPEVRETNRQIQGFIGGDAPPRLPPPAPLAPGAVLAAPPADGVEPDNLRTTLRDVRALVATLKPAVDDIRGTVKRVEPDLTDAVKSAKTAFDGVNGVLSPANQKEFSDLLKNLNSIGLTVLKLAGGFQSLLDEAEKATKNFDARTAAIPDVLNDVRGFTRQFSGPRSEALVKDVAESAAQLNAVLGEVREVVRAFARENGTAQRLLTDPALFNNLDAAAAALARVLTRAERIAGDLEVFADKVARRPELIGVGGVVRPSSGLKDSPFAPAPVPPGLPSYRPDWPPALPAARPSPDGWRAPVQGQRP